MALPLVGLRRSELAAFDLRDAMDAADGLVRFVGRSRVDYERHGASPSSKFSPP